MVNRSTFSDEVDKCCGNQYLAGKTYGVDSRVHYCKNCNERFYKFIITTRGVVGNEECHSKFVVENNLTDQQKKLLVLDSINMLEYLPDSVKLEIQDYLELSLARFKETDFDQEGNKDISV